MWHSGTHGPLRDEKSLRGLLDHQRPTSGEEAVMAKALDISSRGPGGCHTSRVTSPGQHQWAPRRHFLVRVTLLPNPGLSDLHTKAYLEEKGDVPQRSCGITVLNSCLFSGLNTALLPCSHFSAGCRLIRHWRSHVFFAWEGVEGEAYKSQRSVCTSGMGVGVCDRHSYLPKTILSLLFPHRTLILLEAACVPILSTETWLLLFPLSDTLFPGISLPCSCGLWPSSGRWETLQESFCHSLLP